MNEPLDPSRSTGWRGSLSLITRRPALGALAFFVLTVGFPRLTLGKVGGAALQVADVGLALAWLSWGLEFVRRPRLHLSAPFVASLVFVGVLALSIVFASEPSTRAFFKLAAFTSVVFLPLLTASLVRKSEEFELCLHALFIGAGVTLLVGFSTIVVFYIDRDLARTSLMCGYGQLKSSVLPRLCAPFRNPNPFCNFLAVAASLWLAYAGRRFSRKTTLAVVAMTGVIASLTMSIGLGAMAIGLAVVFLSKQSPLPVRSRLVRLSMVAATAGVAGILAFSAMTTVRAQGEGQIDIGERSLSLFDGPRPSIWRAAWDTIAANPWTGIGYGANIATVTDLRAFVPADKIPTYAGPPSSQLEGHNSYLNVAGQAGIPALIAFLFVLWTCMKDLHRAPALSSRLASLPIAVLGAFWGALIYHGFFAALDESRHLWLLLGLGLALSRVATTEIPTGCADPCGRNVVRVDGGHRSEGGS